jgi:hypothetical protein
MTEAQNTAFNDYGIDPETSMGYAIKTANELTAARNKLALVSDKMSASELQYAQMTLGIIESQ